MNLPTRNLLTPMKVLVENDTKYFYVCFLRVGFLGTTDKEVVSVKAIF